MPTISKLRNSNQGSLTISSIILIAISLIALWLVATGPLSSLKNYTDKNWNIFSPYLEEPTKEEASQFAKGDMVWWTYRDGKIEGTVFDVQYQEPTDTYSYLIFSTRATSAESLDKLIWKQPQEWLTKGQYTPTTQNNTENSLVWWINDNTLQEGKIIKITVAHTLVVQESNGKTQELAEQEIEGLGHKPTNICTALNSIETNRLRKINNAFTQELSEKLIVQGLFILSIGQVTPSMISQTLATTIVAQNTERIAINKDRIIQAVATQQDISLQPALELLQNHYTQLLKMYGLVTSCTSNAEVKQ